MRVSDTEVERLPTRSLDWCCLPGDLAPQLLPLLFSPILLLYPTPTPPWNHLAGGIGMSFVRGRFGAGRCDSTFGLPRLAEFQTPTIFDHNRDSNRNTFYRLPKMGKIINWTLC